MGRLWVSQAQLKLLVLAGEVAPKVPLQQKALHSAADISTCAPVVHQL